MNIWIKQSVWWARYNFCIDVILLIEQGMQSKIRKLVFEVEFDNESSPYRARLQDDSYLSRFIAFRQSILQNLQEYIPVDVVPKPPPRYYTPLLTKGSNNLYNDLKHNKLVRFPRKGAFEITIDNYLVFSRLQTGEWPNVQQLTEWAFKVAEKMLDVQIEKEIKAKELPFQNSESTQQPHPPQLQGPATLKKQILLQRDASEGEAWQEKLPKLAGGEYRNNFASNHATLAVKPTSKHSRYFSKHPEAAFNSQDFQKTLNAFKRQNNPQNNITYRRSQQRQTIYYTDSKPRSKHQSFHWNLGTPRNMSLGRSTLRVSAENSRQKSSRLKNIQLEPLPKEVRVQRDKIQQQLAGRQLIEKEAEEKIEKIELKVSTSVFNSFRTCFELEGNSVIKKSFSGKWTPLLCENVLPLKGQCYFSIGVLRSLQNMVIVGIAPLSYYPNPQKEEENDQPFICYNCSNGMIKDSKLEELSETTNWRLGGDSAPSKRPFQLRVAVDMDTNYIDWYIEDAIVASSKISKPFSQGFRVFVSLFHLEDSLLLNQEGWKDKIRVSKFNNLSYFLPKQQTKDNENESQKTAKQGVQRGPKSKEEFKGNHDPPLGQLLMDQCVQTDSFGKIKRQRISRLIDKKKMLEETNQYVESIKPTQLQQQKPNQAHQFTPTAQLGITAQQEHNQQGLVQRLEQQTQPVSKSSKIVRRNHQEKSQKPENLPKIQKKPKESQSLLDKIITVKEVAEKNNSPKVQKKSKESQSLLDKGITVKEVAETNNSPKVQKKAKESQSHLDKEIVVKEVVKTDNSPKIQKKAKESQSHLDKEIVVKEVVKTDNSPKIQKKAKESQSHLVKGITTKEVAEINNPPQIQKKPKESQSKFDSLIKPKEVLETKNVLQTKEKQVQQIQQGNDLKQQKNVQVMKQEKVEVKKQQQKMNLPNFNPNIQSQNLGTQVNSHTKTHDNTISSLNTKAPETIQKQKAQHKDLKQHKQPQEALSQKLVAKMESQNHKQVKVQLEKVSSPLKKGETDGFIKPDSSLVSQARQIEVEKKQESYQWIAVYEESVFKMKPKQKEK